MKKNRNILILASICIVTVIGCIYALKWHSVYLEKNSANTIITNHIQEIKKEEINNYINENNFSVIYFCTPTDDDCRRFEKEFKRYILKKSHIESIVYLNVSDLSGVDFASKFDKAYNTDELRKTKKYLYELPAIAVYNHTKLIDFVSKNSLTINEVDELLIKYDLGGE